MVKTSRKSKNISPRTNKKSSTKPKPFYASRERTQNNMQMTLKNLGATTKHTKREREVLWEELSTRFGVIITHFEKKGKNLHPFFEVVHKETFDLYSDREIINKAVYKAPFKCAA